MSCLVLVDLWQNLIAIFYIWRIKHRVCLLSNVAQEITAIWLCLVRVTYHISAQGRSDCSYTLVAWFIDLCISLACFFFLYYYLIMNERACWYFLRYILGLGILTVSVVIYCYKRRLALKHFDSRIWKQFAQRSIHVPPRLDQGDDIDFTFH